MEPIQASVAFVDKHEAKIKELLSFNVPRDWAEAALDHCQRDVEDAIDFILHHDDAMEGVVERWRQGEHTPIGKEKVATSEDEDDEDDDDILSGMGSGATPSSGVPGGTSMTGASASILTNDTSIVQKVPQGGNSVGLAVTSPPKPAQAKIGVMTRFRAVLGFGKGSAIKKLKHLQDQNAQDLVKIKAAMQKSPVGATAGVGEGATASISMSSQSKGASSFGVALPSSTDAGTIPANLSAQMDEALVDWNEAPSLPVSMRSVGSVSMADEPSVARSRASHASADWTQVSSKVPSESNVSISTRNTKGTEEVASDRPGPSLQQEDANRSAVSATASGGDGGGDGGSSSGSANPIRQDPAISRLDNPFRSSLGWAFQVVDSDDDGDWGDMDSNRDNEEDVEKSVEMSSGLASLGDAPFEPNREVPEPSQEFRLSETCEDLFDWLLLPKFLARVHREEVMAWSICHGEPELVGDAKRVMEEEDARAAAAMEAEQAAACVSEAKPEDEDLEEGGEKEKVGSVDSDGTESVVYADPWATDSDSDSDSEREGKQDPKMYGLAEDAPSLSAVTEGADSADPSTPMNDTDSDVDDGVGGKDSGDTTVEDRNVSTQGDDEEKNKDIDRSVEPESEPKPDSEPEPEPVMGVIKVSATANPELVWQNPAVSSSSSDQKGAGESGVDKKQLTTTTGGSGAASGECGAMTWAGKKEQVLTELRGSISRRNSLASARGEGEAPYEGSTLLCVEGGGEKKEEEKKEDCRPKIAQKKYTVPNLRIKQDTAVPDSKYDPRKREMHGRWELIFPFSQKSEDLSLQLNKFVGCNNAMGAPQLLKVLVQEVREH